MKYLVGINAGGSKTDFIVTDSELNQIYRSSSAPCNLKKAGVEKAVELLDGILNDVITAAKIAGNDITGLCAGFAGGGRIHDAGQVKTKFQELVNKKYNLRFPVVVTTDAEITLEGAFSGGEGAVLISGTGSIIYVKDRKGIFYRAGGFGRIIGDEGSGYTIGRKGLAAAAKFFDSRGKENLLAGFMKKELNITSSEELIKKVYEENYEPSEFAPLVIKAAEEKDKTAENILDEETDELILHIKAVKNYLGNSFKLCLSGGVITAENCFSALLKEKIKSRFPNIEIIEPVLSPELGAALLIKKKSGL